MVGVVAGKLGPPGGAEQYCVRRVAEILEKALAKTHIPVPRRVRRAVERGKRSVAPACGEPVFPCGNMHRIPSFSMKGL